MSFSVKGWTEESHDSSFFSHLRTFMISVNSGIRPKFPLKLDWLNSQPAGGLTALDQPPRLRTSIMNTPSWHGS